MNREGLQRAHEATRVTGRRASWPRFLTGLGLLLLAWVMVMGLGFPRSPALAASGWQADKRGPVMGAGALPHIHHGDQRLGVLGGDNDDEDDDDCSP